MSTETKPKNCPQWAKRQPERLFSNSFRWSCSAIVKMRSNAPGRTISYRSTVSGGGSGPECTVNVAVISGNVFGNCGGVSRVFSCSCISVISFYFLVQFSHRIVQITADAIEMPANAFPNVFVRFNFFTHLLAQRMKRRLFSERSYFKKRPVPAPKCLPIRHCFTKYKNNDVPFYPVSAFSTIDNRTVG